MMLTSLSDQESSRSSLIILGKKKIYSLFSVHQIRQICSWSLPLQFTASGSGGFPSLLSLCLSCLSLCCLFFVVPVVVQPAQFFFRKNCSMNRCRFDVLMEAVGSGSSYITILNQKLLVSVFKLQKVTVI